MKHFVFLITIAFLLSCQSKKENNLKTHKLIFLTPYFEEYVNSAKKLDPKRRDSCEQKLRENLFLKYFTKCENSNYFTQSRDTSLIDFNLDNLFKTITLINSNKQRIKEKIETALVRIYEYLQYDSVSIFVYPNKLKKNVAKKLEGVSGFTPGSKCILLFIDPSIEGWEKFLEIRLAHEFNHTYWIKHNHSTYGGTLLDFMVCEGKSEAFAHMVYPNIKEPWDTLSLQKKKELWDMIKPQLLNMEAKEQQDFMYGKNQYPFLSGYILGRDLVETALKNTKESEVAVWDNFSPQFILEESGYK